MKLVSFPLSVFCILFALPPAAASAQSVPNWQLDTYYAVGAPVIYDGVEYRCIQAHTTVVGWEPPNTPALWRPVSGDGGGSSCSSKPSAPCGQSTSSTSGSGTASEAGGGGCVAPWSARQVYVGGMTASWSGVNYNANWWTQGQDPVGNNGPAGSGQPWTSRGACSACSTAPDAATGLRASNTTGSGTTLSWNAATAASNCTVSGYAIYENGNLIGSASGTIFVVTGLANQSTYSFTVAAVNSSGTSVQSSTVSVTTGTGGGGGRGGGNMFAPYIDMSLMGGEQLLTIQQQSGITIFTLAFVVDDGTCRASWGGLGQTILNDTLFNGTTISSLVQGVRQNGGDVIISFGGANGTDLSSACTSAAQVQAMYQSVVDKYDVKMIDFDIEGGALSDQTAIDMRNQALLGLKAANAGLIISYTLPVLPTGLVDTGVNMLNRVKSSGLDLDVVNVMAMDYGSANDNNGQMGLDAADAASATEGQIQQAGLSATVGVTPMIGVNDTSTEIFQLSDAYTLLSFARSHSYISRLSMWSVARDNGSCAGQGFASPTCSGISQGLYAFSKVFQEF